MKHLISLLALIAFTITTTAQNAFQLQLAGLDTTIHQVEDVIELPDSNLIFAGTAFHIPGDTTKADPFLIRTDKKGNIIWAKTYAGSVAETVSGLELVDNKLVMSVTTHSFNNQHVFNEFNTYLGAAVLNFDLDGNYISGLAYQDNKNSTFGTSIVSKGNTNYISGYITDGDTVSFISKQEGNSTFDTKIVAKSGHIKVVSGVVSGSKWTGVFASNVTSSSMQPAVVSLNDNGNIDWALAVKTNQSNIPTDILVHNDNYYVCSNTKSGGLGAITVSKISSDGTLVWVQLFYQPNANLVANDILSVSNNEFHINGAHNNNSFTLVIDKEGELVDARKYSSENVSINYSTKTIDGGLLYLQKNVDVKNKNGWLIKNNRNNLYPCQSNVTGFITATDITFSATTENLESRINVSNFELDVYPYEFNNPTIKFDKEIFPHTTCFKCDVNTEFTYSVDAECYKITFSPKDSTLHEFHWDFDDLESFSSEKNPTYEYRDTGSYNVTLMGFNKCGMATTTQVVKVNSKFMALFDETIDCNTIVATPSNNKADDYIWETNNAIFPNQQTLNYTYDAPGSYTVRLTANNRCVKESFLRIIEIEDRFIKPDFSFSNSCEEYTFTIDNDNNINDRSWSFGDGQIDNSNSSTIQHNYPQGIVPPPNEYIASCTVSNECFSETYSTTILVDDYRTDPDFTFTNNCNTLTFESSPGNASAILWDFGNGTTSTQEDPVHDFGLSGGTFTVSLHVTNDCGEVDSKTQNISLNDFDIDPDFTSTLQCDIIDFLTTEPPANIDGVFWDFDDGFEATGASTTHTYENDGNYNVTMAAYNQCEQEIVTKVVNYTNPNYNAHFTYVNNCGDITFTNTSVTTNAISYTWNYGDNAQSNVFEETHTYQPGTYNVSLTVDYGCETKTYSETIEIINERVNPEFTANVFCYEVEFELTDNTNLANIVWDLGNGSTKNNTTNFTYDYTTNGTFDVKVYVTSICGSIDSLTKTIVLSNQVIANAGEDVTICQGKNVELQATGGRTFSWTPVNSLTNPNIGNPKAFPTTTTTYTVTVSDNVCTGTDTDQITVYVVPRPAATISGKQTICEGDSAAFPVTFTGTAPYSLEYTAGGNTYFFGPTNNITDSIYIKDAGVANLVNVTDNVCTAAISGSAEVNMNFKPVASFTSNTYKVCDSDFTGLDIPVSITENGDWEVTFAINGFNQQMDVINSQPYNYSISQAGTYTISKVQNANCIGKSTGKVVVIDNPSPTATFNYPNSICGGTTIPASINLSGNPPYNFDIYIDGVLDISVANYYRPSYDYIITQGGDYEIRNLTDKNCTSSQNFGPYIIEEISTPTALIYTEAGSNSLCQGTNAIVKFYLEDASSYEVTYAIDGIAQPSFTTPNGGGYNIETSTPGTYTLISVSNNGCEGSVSGSAIIHPEPSASISGNIDICSNETKQLNISLEGKSSYNLIIYKDGSFHDAISTSSQDFEYSVTEGGVYTVFSMKDQNNCPAQQSKINGQGIVNQYETSIGVISGGGPICENTTDTIHINFTQGTKPHHFAYTRNNSHVEYVENYMKDHYSFVTDAAGDYRLPYLYNNKCTNTPINNTPTTVSHITIPTAKLTASDTICDGEPHEFKVELTGAGYKTLTYSYEGSNYITDSILVNSFNITSLAEGDYKLIAIEDKLCYSEEVYTFGRLTVNKLPALQISGDTAKCAYDSVPLFYDFTGVAPFSADLYRQDNFERTVEPIYTHHFALPIKKPGHYSVVQFSDANCTNILNSVVVIDNLPSPVVRFGGGGLYCDADTFAIKNKTIKVDSSDIFTWYFDNGETSNDTSMVDSIYIPFSEDRCYDIRLEHTTLKGCVFDTTMYNIVCVDHKPEPNFTYTPEEPTIFTDYIQITNETYNGAEFVWTFNNGLDGENENFNTFYSSFNRDSANTTNICLKATSYLGCQNTLCKEVNIKDEFTHYVPNSFTPNGDGVNDVFGPVVHNTDDYLFELVIFNRFGEMVFSTEEVKKPIWDGKINGDPAKQDMYSWRLKIKSLSTNDSHIEFGKVYILY